MEYRTQPMVRARDQEQERRPERREMRQQEMRRTKEYERGCCGHLPAYAPLANPYVPFQPNDPPTYPAKNGVVRGTLFPGLDLPFMGMVNDKPLSDTHLHELQTLGFAVVELGEYLDTHPEDKEAFDLFRSYVDMYKEGKKRYEKEHGPLMQSSAADGECYDWLKDPWPWEYAANHAKEG